MSIVSYALKGSLGNFVKKLDKVSETTGKSKIALFTKFSKCMMFYGFGYSDYLNYELYNKTNKEIKEYASIKDQDKFYEIASPSMYKKFFTIKPDFLKNFKKYIDRDFFYEGSKNELDKFLNSNDSFMIKPVDGLGGTGVDRLYTKDIQDREEFYEKLKNENLFLEGFVEQHKELNKFCDTCVNTLRIMTFNYGNESKILFAALRVGNGEASVDNFHKGGMGVLVDIDSGKLIGDAIDKSLNHYDKHPKTKVKFEGFTIPNWDIVKKTVLEAAKVNQNIHVVGWDVAITKEGCTFIEGNRRPGFDLVQVLSLRGRKDIMREVINELNKKEHKGYKI